MPKNTNMWFGLASIRPLKSESMLKIQTYGGHGTGLTSAPASLNYYVVFNSLKYNYFNLFQNAGGDEEGIWA